MKTIILFPAFCALFFSLNAQHLDVEGHAKIRGNLDLSHMTDSSSLVIGRIAGTNSDYTQQLQNTMLGVLAGNGNTVGYSNTFLGYKAGNSNTEGRENVFIGYAGIANTTGSQNTFVGHLTGMNNIVGDRNTAVGYRALYNISVGGDGGHGHEEVAIGTWALEHSKSRGNVAVGTASLRNLELGSDNVSVGGGSLLGLVTGSYNTVLGSDAMRNTDSTAHNNVAIGKSAGENAKGGHNTYVGTNSAFNVRSGFGNVMIGSGAQGSDSSSANQIVIGLSADGVKDNSVVLGNGEVTDIFMAEDSEALIHASNAKLSSLASNSISDSLVVILPDSTLAVRDASSIGMSINSFAKLTSNQVIGDSYTTLQNMSFGLEPGVYSITANLFSNDVYDVDVRLSYSGTIEESGWGFLRGRFSNNSAEITDQRLSDLEMNTVQGFVEVSTSGTMEIQMKRYLTELDDIVLLSNSYITLTRVQ